MTSKQENKLSMLKELLRFIDGNDALLAPIPTATDSKNQLKALIGKLEGLAKDQMTNIKAHTADKLSKRETLTKAILAEATKLGFLADDTSNDLLRGASNITRTALDRKRDSLLVIAARDLFDTLNTNQAALAPFGITAASLVDYQSKIEIYDDAIGEKSFAYIRRLSGTRGIDEVLSASTALVKRLRKTVALTDNSTLIAQFEDAAKIDNIGVRHYSVEGVITDDEDGLAVAGALITLYGANGNKHTDKTNELGFYHLKGLGAGEYKMTVQRSGFFDHVANILIKKGNLSKVDVALAFDNSGETESV